jgi:hypothetical protein
MSRLLLTQLVNTSCFGIQVSMMDLNVAPRMGSQLANVKLLNSCVSPLHPYIDCHDGCLYAVS